MNRTRIKICGITRPMDAVAAAQAGADAIGMVFHEESKRTVTVKQASEILLSLPVFVTPVALFVNSDPKIIRETASALHIRHIQLHGEETPDIVNELRGLSVIKAIRADRVTLRYQLESWMDAIWIRNLGNLHGLVLETPHTSQPGGTGVANDWEGIREIQTTLHREEYSLPPLIAAGGLRPEIVGGVVRSLRPYAVDVSSGVEEKPGEKSPDKIRAFIDAVRQADAS